MAYLIRRDRCHMEKNGRTHVREDGDHRRDKRAEYVKEDGAHQQYLSGRTGTNIFIESTRAQHARGGILMHVVACTSFPRARVVGGAHVFLRHRAEHCRTRRIALGGQSRPPHPRKPSATAAKSGHARRVSVPNDPSGGQPTSHSVSDCRSRDTSAWGEIRLSASFDMQKCASQHVQGRGACKASHAAELCTGLRGSTGFGGLKRARTCYPARPSPGCCRSRSRSAKTRRSHPSPSHSTSLAWQRPS